MIDDISVLICTFNEAERIAKAIESVKGVGEVIICDDGSSDRTVEIAKSLGAKIYIRPKFIEIPIKDDVDNFMMRFGWKPRFTTDTKIRNGGATRMDCLKQAKYSFVYFPDADEIVTWDLTRIKKEILPIADQIESLFVHSHKPDGSPENISKITKLFRKSVSRIEARVHDVLLPYGRIVSIDFMRIDHYQKQRLRTEVLPILEYSVIKDDDSRSRFYLGREYYYCHEYEKAIKLLERYLKDATWIKEIAHAHLYMARSYWEWSTGPMTRGDRTREHCLEAIRINPDFKEALNLMSDAYFEPWKSKWKFIADNATNKDILF